MNDLDVVEHSQALRDVNIGLCVGGGIAAIETPRVIRELRRRGATVKVYATENALKFVGRDALEWSSTFPVLSSSSGLAEHIAREEMVLVMPATADLISKAAQGICPEICSTYLQSALGMEKQILFLPTMHDSMRRSPAIIRNIALLSNFSGVEFIEPRVEEGKWKAPTPEAVALEVAHRFNKKRNAIGDQKKKRALVTLGGTLAQLDSARAISNFSTGTLGSYLIESLLESGIEVVALCASHSANLPSCSGLKVVKAPLFQDFQDWLGNKANTTNFDALFHLAAVSDYGAKEVSRKKIESTSENLVINLRKLPKLIAMPNLDKIPLRIACKYTATNSRSDADKALHLLQKHSLNAVYWNWGSDAFGDSNCSGGVLVKGGNQLQTEIHSKRQAARVLCELLSTNSQSVKTKSSRERKK